MTSAKYISEKCGNVTIAVTNKQMPLMPLFSPIYTSTRPYSQTRSNTQRALMQPDEVLRLDYQKCIALFQGHKPALLYKLTPEEFPACASLVPCRVADYVPAWKQKEQREEQPPTAGKKPTVTQRMQPAAQKRDSRPPEKQTARRPVAAATASMEPAFEYKIEPEQEKETHRSTRGVVEDENVQLGMSEFSEQSDSAVLGMDDDDGYEQEN